MNTENVLRVASMIISILAVIVIWREHHPPHRLTRAYIIFSVMLLAAWRLSLFLSLDVALVPETTDLVRRIAGPSVAIAMSFALVLAVRAHDEV